jgi:hypothetical protein
MRCGQKDAPATQWFAWARPRRKRNEDGEVPQMAIACPETDNDLMILRGPIAIREVRIL